MKIELDSKNTIVINKNWGNPELVVHDENPKFDKQGNPLGHRLYFRTFGQLIKTYIMKSAAGSDVNSFEELASFIDGKLKGVELKIDQTMEASNETN